MEPSFPIFTRGHTKIAEHHHYSRLYITGFAYPFEKVWPWGQPILMKIGLWVGLVVSWKVLQGKILFRSIIDFFGRRLFSDISPSASSDDDENNFYTIILVLEFTGRSFV